MANPLVYSQAGDFPGGKCNAGNLTDDLLESTALVTALRPGPVSVSGDVVEVWFNSEPVAADVTEVDSLVAAHDSTPKPRQPITEDGTPIVHQDGPRDSKTGLPIVHPLPYREGVSLCDRDVLIKTCIVDGVEAVEDVKCDATDSRKRKSWGEAVLVGVFKGDDSSGYSTCADQADADASGVLSVFRYYAKAQDGSGDPIDYDIRGGEMWIDDVLDVLDVLEEVDPAKKWAHQVYVTALPDLPAAVGGSVRMFDAYLYPYRGNWIETINPVAMLLDPLVAGPPANPLLTTVELAVFHPPGSKNEHVFRFLTYRNPATY